MSSKQYLGLLAVLVVVAASAFYWYDLRPKEIKKKCLNIQQSTEKKLRTDMSKNTKYSRATDNQFKMIEDLINERLDEAYKQCLIENGL